MGIRSDRTVHWYSPGLYPVRLSLIARAQDTFSWRMSEKSSVGFTCAQPILPPITSLVSSAEDGVNYRPSASVPYKLLTVMCLEDKQQPKDCAANPVKFCNLPGSLWASVSCISSAFVAKDPLIRKGGAVALQKRYSSIPDKNNYIKSQFPHAFCCACTQLVLNSILEL